MFRSWALTSILAPRRIESVDIGFDLLGGAFVYELASSDTAGIRGARSRRRELAFDAVHARPEHDGDELRTLVQHHNFHHLARLGDAHLDRFVFHDPSPRAGRTFIHER